MTNSSDYIYICIIHLSEQYCSCIIHASEKTGYTCYGVRQHRFLGKKKLINVFVNNILQSYSVFGRNNVRCATYACEKVFCSI